MSTPYSTQVRAAEVDMLRQLLRESRIDVTPPVDAVLNLYVDGKVGLAAVHDALSAQLDERPTHAPLSSSTSPKDSPP